VFVVLIWRQEAKLDPDDEAREQRLGIAGVPANPFDGIEVWSIRDTAAQADRDYELAREFYPDSKLHIEDVSLSFFPVRSVASTEEIVSRDILIVELDSCNEDALPHMEGVRTTLVQAIGPSGWPVVEVRGERDLVKEYVLTNWGDDALESLY
jgi:hypothetical protein